MSVIVARALLPLLLLGVTSAFARPKAPLHPSPSAESGETEATVAIDPALAADIRRLLKVTGAGALAVQSLETMVAQMKAVRPDIPAAFWEAFQAEVDPDGLIELLVPVYARHFNRQEVQALLAFYASPAGRRFVEETPALMQEASVVGQQWGQEVAQRVVAKMLLSPGGLEAFEQGGLDDSAQGGSLPPSAP